jgi:hypothetical protein
MTEKNEYLEILSNYESPQLVRRQFKTSHNLELNATTAREIVTSFRQARGYLEASHTADRTVRPLLVYYAILGYSRGLTMFLKPGTREASLSQSHGLSVEGWGEELSADTGDVSNLRIRLNANGTLSQLIDATNHQSLLRNNSSRPNYIATLDKPPDGSVMTFGQILARFPEIHQTFIRWRNDRCAVSIWPQKDAPGGGKEVRVDHPFGEEDWRAVFGELPVTKSGSVLTGIIPSDLKLSLSDATGQWDIGTIIAMTRYPAGIELSKAATAFTFSYALGMLVRYFPSHWMGMLYGHRHDAALPTLLAALSQVVNDFPRFVVEFLERQPKQF